MLISNTGANRLQFGHVAVSVSSHIHDPATRAAFRDAVLDMATQSDAVCDIFWPKTGHSALEGDAKSPQPDQASGADELILLTSSPAADERVRLNLAEIADDMEGIAPHALIIHSTALH